MGGPDRVRVHVGSGDKYWPGFINADKYSARADRQCSCTALGFDANSVDELYAIHLLEHLHRMEAATALKEWCRVLKAKGKLVLELPSLDKIIRLLMNKEPNIRLTLLGLYGDPRDPRPGMEHKWGWSMEELEGTLREIGFKDIEFREPVFHLPQRDMRVEAVKA